MFAYLTGLALAAPASALSLAECPRVTHPAHAGEAGHRDFGGGLVGYAEWWSMEGVYTDVVIADCGRDVFLRTRVREERISQRVPFDRTDDAITIIDREMQVSPSLFSFERLAEAITPTGRDIEIAPLLDEPCACAAAYPQLTGQKTPYQRDQ